MTLTPEQADRVLKYLVYSAQALLLSSKAARQQGNDAAFAEITQELEGAVALIEELEGLKKLPPNI